MAKLDVVKVFLASPGDVPKERAYVEKVVADLNRTVAANYGVHLKLFSSERALPGFGGGGQSVINRQTGRMNTYELFLCIMWSRIGTRTPRAKSGTVEEFKRAERAFNQYGNPNIWIYFRDAPIPAKTQDELGQKAEVLKFREDVRVKGLLKEYRSATDFKEKLRDHLIDWIHSRSQKSIAKGRANRTKAAVPAKAPSTPNERKRPAIKTISKTLPVTEPSNWVMLNNKFYRLDKSSSHAEQNIVLHLRINRLEQEELKLLRPGQYSQKKQVNFADKVDAGLATVESVGFETAAGKTIATVSLTAFPSPNQNNVMTEFNTRTHTADDIAKLRAQRILLGQELPHGISSFGLSAYFRNTHSPTATTYIGTLPELWADLKATARDFLPKAWLYAAYLLKTEGIIESIRVLEIGPIQKKQMRVKFRGQRRKVYSNHDPVTISFEGICSLES